MFIRILPTTLLQTFCENLLYFQVILKRMKIADDTFLGNSECDRLSMDGFKSFFLSSICNSSGIGVLLVLCIQSKNFK